MTSPDICKATARRKGRLLICDLPLHHKGLHQQEGTGEAVTWPPDEPLTGDERVYRL